MAGEHLVAAKVRHGTRAQPADEVPGHRPTPAVPDAYPADEASGHRHPPPGVPGGQRRRWLPAWRRSPAGQRHWMGGRGWHDRRLSLDSGEQHSDAVLIAN